MTDYSQFHVLFPPAGYLLGIDSRSWNGKVPDGFPKLSFAGIKLTDLFIPGDHVSDEAKGQIDGCLANGIEPLLFHWFSYRDKNIVPEKAGEDQAILFHNAANALGVGSKPRIADVEDDPSHVGLRTMTALRAFDRKTMALALRRPGIYTAPYFWNPRMVPFDSFYGDWSPYDTDLWVADPDPVNAALPGKWKKWVIRQLKLDWSCPGFNAKIDVNWVSKEWFDKTYGAPLPPTPPPAPTLPVPVLIRFPGSLVDLTIEKTA